MKRRDFFTASAAAGIAMSGALAPQASAADNECVDGKQLLDLRVYACPDAEKRDAMIGWIGEAIAAVNELGVTPVGVFTAPAELNEGVKNVDAEALPNQIFMLLPHDNCKSLLTLNRALLANPDFVADGADYFSAVKGDVLFDHFDSSLMLAFDKCPKVETPTSVASRVMQLRIYEGPNEERAAKKVAMFNNGEMDVFREVGMNPVFFGEQLVGPLMPTLRYMLAFDDMAAKDEAWGKFLKHPKWNELKNDPQYKDTVSRITNIMLRPAACSQI